MKSNPSKVRYGGALIQEQPDWLQRHPLGPVHWIVWNARTGELLGDDVSAHDLCKLLVAKGLLIQW